MKQEHAPLTEGVYYMLLSLYEPRHGYGMMQYISELTNDRVQLGAGTIYGAIKTLLKRQWIKPFDTEGRRKKYIITKTGKEIVEHEVERLRELYENGLNIVEEKE